MQKVNLITQPLHCGSPDLIQCQMTHHCFYHYTTLLDALSHGFVPPISELSKLSYHIPWKPRHQLSFLRRREPFDSKLSIKIGMTIIQGNRPLEIQGVFNLEDIFLADNNNH